MVSALASRRSTRLQGVIEVSPRVDPMLFFSSCIVKILEEGAASPAARDAQPILKAAALKFVATFRNQFTSEQASMLVGMCAAFLPAHSEVVASYAAVAIQYLASVRGPPISAASGAASTIDAHAARAAAAVTGPFRVPRSELARFLRPCLDGLFARMETQLRPLTDPSASSAARTAARRDNPYAAQCTMRLLSLCNDADPAIAPLGPSTAQAYLGRLAGLLTVAAGDPCRPRFDHFLFEALAAALRAACRGGSTEAIAVCERGIFALVQPMIAKPVVEFLPYIFQVLALLLRIGGGSEGAPAAAAAAAVPAPPPPSDGYRTLLPVILSAPLWSDDGNVPAISALVRAYLARDAAGIATPALMAPLFERVMTAVQRRSTEEEGFSLYRAMAQHLPRSSFEPSLAPALRTFVVRLMAIQLQGGVRFLRQLLPTMATIACSHGGGVLASGMAAALGGDGPARDFINNVVAPQLDKVMVRGHRRTCILGWSRFLAEAPWLIPAGDPRAFGALLVQVHRMLGSVGDAAVGEEEAEATRAAEAAAAIEGETSGVSFSRLQQATIIFERADPFAATPPAPTFAAALAARARSEPPGTVRAVLASLDSADAVAIHTTCSAAGHALA